MRLLWNSGKTSADHRITDLHKIVLSGERPDSMQLTRADLITLSISPQAANVIRQLILLLKS